MTGRSWVPSNSATTGAPRRPNWTVRWAGWRPRTTASTWLLSARVVGETFRTGNDLQEQALYGGPLDDPAPTAPEGLAVAADGLSWTLA
ncbi:hypothetical protein [Streptomyces sp. NPDC048581]|uniref:hypothetical protein n=1 Tax=unclassified Streptomyces TaxID=2593676 RepID=UPI00371844EC